MSEVNIKKITERSWIASTSGSPMGIINEGDDCFTFMTPESTHKFPNMKAIKTFLGGRVSEHLSEARSGLDSSVQEEINGFPVKHDKFTVVDTGERPVYIRGKQSQHVAGYWCIKFSQRWVPSFCPLLRTVEQYQSSGPFKNRLEMMSHLSLLNKQ